MYCLTRLDSASISGYGSVELSSRRIFRFSVIRPFGRSLLAASLLLFHWSAPAEERTPTNTFFLPKSPVAAAYVLGRLSNAELIAAPRSEFVYVALLQRQGLERKYRLEGLEGLSELRHTDSLTELRNALIQLDKRGEESADTLRDLLPILLQAPRQELAAQRASLIGLATKSQLPLTRQMAYAACITAEASPEPLWEESQPKPAQLVDLVLAVPFLQQPSLRTEFYSRLEPLVQSADGTQVRRAAIIAIVSIPAHQAGTFDTLAGLVQAGSERDTAIASLLRIPQKFWSKEHAGPLATNLVQHLQSVPAADRTSSPFLNALQLATDLASLLPEDDARALGQKLRSLGPTIIVLRAVYEQMRFDKQLIVVEAGKPVSITLQNDDAMPHNLALILPGSLEEIGQAAEKMPAEPDAQGRLYVPASPKLLYATRMIAPGQNGQLAFTAPAERGDYPYVCTFPGHWRRMAGILAVVKDVDAYLASQTQSLQPKITEWKLGDLALDLANIGPRQNLEEGREFFTKLACVQCHKLGEQGYGYGPDLSDVFVKYKNDRASVLQQILEPSKVIEDRYRNYNFDLKGAEPVLGMVVKEDADTVTVQTGPADSLIQTFKKSAILQRRPQNSSPMPVGLLNSLTKEQILDLLAYLESGGRAYKHAHNQ